MAKCTPKLLTQGAHFSIAICTFCQRMGFHYNNLVAGFKKEDFIGFAKEILATSFHPFAQPFPPDGGLKTIVKTCHEDIQWAFDEDEFAELQDLLQQTVLMLEAEEILNPDPS